eukprot:scaffold13669_cov56-Phaeocystis_antarctica.AAC.1
MDPKWPENQIRPRHLAASELQVLRLRSEQHAGVEGPMHVENKAAQTSASWPPPAGAARLLSAPDHTPQQLARNHTSGCPRLQPASANPPPGLGLRWPRVDIRKFRSFLLDERPTRKRLDIQCDYSTPVAFR